MEATFSVAGGEERNVLKFSFSFSQSYDEFGKPNGKVQGGRVYVELALRKGDSSIPEWALDAKSVLNGSLKLMDNTSPSVSKSIDFKDAYCVKYEEFYNSEQSQDNQDLFPNESLIINSMPTRPMLVKFTLSARVLTIAGIEHENIWKNFV